MQAITMAGRARLRDSRFKTARMVGLGAEHPRPCPKRRGAPMPFRSDEDVRRAARSGAGPYAVTRGEHSYRVVRRRRSPAAPLPLLASVTGTPLPPGNDQPAAQRASRWTRDKPGLAPRIPVGVVGGSAAESLRPNGCRIWRFIQLRWSPPPVGLSPAVANSGPYGGRGSRQPGRYVYPNVTGR
jgi:hypothetical protein